MPDSFLRSILSRLPPIASRDERIDMLTRQVSDLRDELVRRPSFQARLHAERRLRALSIEVGAPSTSVIRHGKLHVYDLARSHGIDPPAEFGRWDDPAVIPWSDLPDLVVVKSAFSSASRGVLPLRRSGGGWRIVADDETLSDDQVVAKLTALTKRGTARPPWVVEEFLDEDGTGTRLPTDVKAYAFYGEVPMVVLRRPGQHGDGPYASPFRVVDAHGDDIDELETESPIDTSMPVPHMLGEVVTAASLLSVAIRAPFSRLDFYCIGERVVFGEVTPRPGGSGWHGATVDLLLGEAWDRAQARLARDVAAGMSPEPELGPFS